MAGAANLRKQVENIQIHGVTPVIAINAFPGDHPSEHRAIREPICPIGSARTITRSPGNG